MTPAQLKIVRKIVEARLGLLVPDGSELHLENCLQKLAETLGIPSVTDFFQALASNLVPDSDTLITEAIIDKETAFFRDMADLQALQKIVLPKLIQRRATERRLVFWSAGCSSGQEPYSIAIFLRENFPELLDWNLEVHATDFVRENVERAAQARYTKDEVNRGLPAPLLIKYFTKVEGDWQLNDSIRRWVHVHQDNLAEPTVAIPRADVVLLRHVMKNLNGPTQALILKSISASINPDGVLFLTGNEHPAGLDVYFFKDELPDTAFFRPKTYLESGG